MALLALVGIAANGAAVLRVRAGKTLNSRVIAWHLLEDVLGWVEVDVRLLEHDIEQVPGVVSAHHTHAWSLDGERHVITTHVVVPSAATKRRILTIKRHVLELMNRADLEHSTVEIEYEDEDCRMKLGAEDAGSLA